MDGVQHVAGYELPEKNGRAFMSCICCVAVEVQPPSPSTSNSSNKCFTSTTTSITHEMELINIILEGVHSSEESERKTKPRRSGGNDSLLRLLRMTLVTRGPRRSGTRIP